MNIRTSTQPLAAGLHLDQGGGAANLRSVFLGRSKDDDVQTSFQPNVAEIQRRKSVRDQGRQRGASEEEGRVKVSVVLTFFTAFIEIMCQKAKKKRVCEDESEDVLGSHRHEERTRLSNERGEVNTPVLHVGH